MQRTTNPLPKHSSYGQRPVPSLQLLSKLSKFDGYKKYEPSAQTPSVPVTEIRVEKSDIPIAAGFQVPPKAPETNEPSILNPNHKSSTTGSARNLNIFQDETQHRNHYNKQMDSTVGKLFLSENRDGEFLTEAELPIPAKRMSYQQNTNEDNYLIGGVPPSGDPWQTTNQQMSSGEPNHEKAVSKKKLLSALTKEYFVSPITGEAMEDNGNWQEEYLQSLNNNKKNTKTSTLTEKEEDEFADDPIMMKLRAKLNQRGVKGIISLARTFRIMDDDGSKSLSLIEFKKAMKDFQTGLTDNEMLVLFKRFDLSKVGHISYNDFLTTLGGKMNKRRRALVASAFKKLDKDQSGTIEVAELAKVYDTSKHPDVVTKKKTPNEVLLEFLNNFDIGGTQGDGKVSLVEFENYYRAISASIDNDDYFELMMRNAWHISGGEGWAANTSNRRVLVKDAQGNERVVEVEDDMGLDSNDMNALKAKLKSQGVQNVEQVTLYGGADESAPARNPQSRPAFNRPQTAPTRPRSKSAQRRSNQNDSSGQVSTLAPADVQMLIKQIKETLKARGSAGIIGLQRTFRIMDDDGNKTLSFGEFKKAMKDQCKFTKLSDVDLRKLFEYFDNDKSGSIEFEEFLQGIRDPLNEKRKKLIELAFARLDTDGSGIVDVKEIAGMYDPSKHPEVLAKRKTPNQVLEEFLSTFDVGGVRDNCVTLQEFMNYYHNISASIDNDDYFELMMRNAWHISGGEGWAANSANMTVMVTDKQGNEKTIQLMNDLGIGKDDTSKIYARLVAQGVPGASIAAINGKTIKVVNVNGVEIVSVTGTTPANPDNASFANTQVKKAPPFRRVDPNPIITNQYNAQQRPVMLPNGDAVPVALNKSTTNSDPVSKRPATSSSLHIQSTRLADSVTKQLNTKVVQAQTKQQQQVIGATLFDVFRTQLLAQGLHGIINLQRLFQTFDTNNNGTIDREEFRQIVASNKQMVFSEEQANSLFDYIDTNGSDNIDYEEFLNNLRVPLNPRILVLLHQIFDKLAQSSTSSASSAKDAITPSELLAHYDHTNHPDLLHKAGVSEKSLYEEFLQTFDVGQTIPNCITRDEFIGYYHNLSSVLQDDEYVEMILRAVWHMPQGNVRVVSQKAPIPQQRRPSSANSTSSNRSKERIQSAQVFAQHQEQRSTGGYGIMGIQGQSAPLTPSNYGSNCRRPSTASSTPRGNNSQQLSGDYQECYKQGIQLYNAQEFVAAYTMFQQAKRLVQAMYPVHHPECQKMEKSLVLVERKAKYHGISLQ